MVLVGDIPSLSPPKRLVSPAKRGYETSRIEKAPPTMRGAFNLGMVPYFEAISRVSIVIVFADCLATDLHPMTFVASGLFRIRDGMELISCQECQLPRTSLRTVLDATDVLVGTCLMGR